MDDDLPKEGELLDISKKRAKVTSPHVDGNAVEKSQSKFPVVPVIVLILLAGAVFGFKKFSGGNSDPEKVALYKQSTESVISTMKGQLPYLENVGCEGANPDKDDCFNFIGRFRPIKDSPNYISSMGTIDKAEGISSADIEIIKAHIKVLLDAKRTILSSGERITFLIDSVTVPKVGDNVAVKIKCTGDGVDTVTCESVK